MIEIYLWILLGLIILFGLGSVIFSVIIFFPKKYLKFNTYKSEYYGEHYKEKKYPNITEILEKEIAKRNDKF